MATENGSLVVLAFKAAVQCQQDVGKLIRDLNGRMNKEGWVRLGEGRDAVTYGVSKRVHADHWMAPWVYRLFKNPTHPKLVDGVNIFFFSEHALIREPLMIVGRAEYRVADGKTVVDSCDIWDLTKAYTEWSGATLAELGKVLLYEDAVGSRIERIKFVTVDLYSIGNMADIQQLLDQVRQP